MLLLVENIENNGGKMIPFNIPPYVGKELEYVNEAIDNRKICGDGQFTKKCNKWIEDRFNAQKVLLTTSGTTALEMAMILSGLKEGDEVVLLFLVQLHPLFLLMQS